MLNKISRYIDIPTIAIVLLICAIGLFALYSASFQNGVFLKHDVFFKQITWIILGVIIYFATIALGHRKILGYAYLLYCIMIVLLLLVLLVGSEKLGAQRWFNIFGINFQPSEISKLIVILVLARYLSKFIGCCSHRANIPLLSGFIFSLGLVALPALLIFLEPDLGTACVLFPIFIFMIFYAGIKLKYFFSLFSCVLLVVPFLWHLLKDYQRTRLLVFLNPNLDPLGAGYTIIQSKIAIGSGRFFGKGWLSGTQNQLNFLPERHTDFIFSVIGEEWGFLGSVVLLGLFFILILRFINSISATIDSESKLLVVGIITFFSTQILINIAMAIGLVPVVGLPLPFISYGGSSMLICFIALGLVSSVSRAKKI